MRNAHLAGRPGFRLQEDQDSSGDGFLEIGRCTVRVLSLASIHLNVLHVFNILVFTAFVVAVML